MLSETVYPMSGHNMVEDKALSRPATCDAAGYLKTVCSVCGTGSGKEIPATGHELKKDETRSKEATCSAPGQEVQVCTNDGCDFEQVTELTQLSHKFQDDGEDKPGCETPGHKKRVCTVCGEKETYDEKPMTGHNFLAENARWEWSEDHMKATVTLVCATNPNHTKTLTAVVTAEQSGGCENGKVTYTAVATFNKGEFTDTYEEVLESKAHTPDTKLFNEDPEKHYYICTTCGAQVDAADHTWNNGTTVTTANCTREGLKRYTCTKCKAVKEEIIPITHSFKNGKCTKCGASESCNHLANVRKVTALDTLGLCGGEYFTFSCTCGESSYNTINKLTCQLGRGEQTTETLADGTEVDVTTYTCSQCGAVVQIRTWNVYENECVYQERSTFTIQKGGKTVLEGQTATGGEDDYKYHTETEPEIIRVDGLCGSLEKRSCICGEDVYYMDSCFWQYDEASSTDEKEVRVCEECGAVKTDTYTRKATGKRCEAEVTNVCTYTQNGKQVYTYTTKYVIEDHNEENVKYSFVLCGTSCRDGVFVYAKCSDCGVEDGTYLDDHFNNFNSVETNLSGKGMCLTKATQYACPCGQYKTMYVDGGCRFDQKISESETATSYNAVYKCSKCGGTQTVKGVITIGANCAITQKIDYTYKNKSGTTVYTGTNQRVDTQHEFENTMKLLGETCEDGVQVTSTCKNCGITETSVAHDHITTEREVDISALGACSTYVEMGQCACGYRSYFHPGYDWDDEGNYIGCDMWHVSESDNQEIVRCDSCGLTQTNTWTDRVDGCKIIRDFTITFTREGKTPVTITASEVFYEHTYVYTVALADGAQTCDDGMTYSGVCTACGKTDEGENYYCAALPVKRETVQVAGDCGNFQLITYACACGAAERTELDFGKCKMEGYGFTYDDEGNRLYLYRCEECGRSAKYSESSEKVAGTTCKYRYNFDWIICDQNDQQLTTVRAYDTELNCVRKVADLKLYGQTCEDGFEYSLVCAACGRDMGENYVEAGQMTCDEFAEWYASLTMETELLYTADCGGQLWAEHTLGCPCGTYDYGWGWNYIGGVNYVGDDYRCDCGEEGCDLRWTETEEQISKDAQCNATYKWTITVYDGETVVKTLEKTNTRKEHTEVTVDSQLYGQTCDDGFTETLRCVDCGAERTREDYSCYGHITAYETWTDGCGGYFALRECLCGEWGYSVDYNRECLISDSYRDWTTTDEAGVEHDFMQYSCDKCGMTLTYDMVAAPVAGETCMFDVSVTATVVTGGTMLVRENFIYRQELHDIEYSYTLLPGAESCEDGVRVSKTCSRCYFSDEDDVYYQHMVGEVGTVDLAQHGAKCGCKLVKYACPCGENVRYDFADDSLCDLDEEQMTDEELRAWQPEILGYSHTTRVRWFYSDYGWTYTCAVTSPECGFKLRMAEIWLPEANCMAGEYQIWEVYDSATDSWKEILRTETGEHHAYHEYTETDIEERVDGAEVYGTQYTCPDCGSTATDKTTRYPDGSYKGEWIATNTLYMSNGEPRQRHDTQVYDYKNPLAAVGYNWLYTLDMYTWVTADGEELWEKYEYTWDIENGCAYSRVYSRSDGYRYEKSGTHGMGGSSSSGYGKVPTCTQEGFYGFGCNICGAPWDDDFVMIDPTDHTFRLDSATGMYECEDCGLESAVGASGGIALEDLNYTMDYDESKYVVGYWNQLGGQFTPYIYVVAEDATDEDKVFALVGMDVQWLTVEEDGVRAITLSKTAAHEAAEAVLAAQKPGYTGRYAIRVELVPNDSSNMHDYAITFDPVYP